MHDEVEFLIEQILARQEEAEAGGPVRDPNCPEVTLLMAVALDQVPAEKQREVEEHAQQCEECRWRLEDYRKYFRDEESAEPAVKGSRLESAADRRPFEAKRPPGPEDHPPPPAGGDPTVVGAEQATTQKPSPAEAGASSEERDVGTVTRAARMVRQNPELWPGMVAQLRPWLVALLRRAGVDVTEVDPLLAFIRERLLATPLQESYRPLVLDWVREFTATSRLQSIDEALIEQAALDQVLQRRGEHEPREARLFCEEALREALPSAQALLKFAPEAVAQASWLPTFRLQLFYEAEKLKVKGLQFFQWN